MVARGVSQQPRATEAERAAHANLWTTMRVRGRCRHRVFLFAGQCGRLGTTQAKPFSSCTRSGLRRVPRALPFLCIRSPRAPAWYVDSLGRSSAGSRPSQWLGTEVWACPSRATGPRCSRDARLLGSETVRLVSHLRLGTAPLGCSGFGARELQGGAYLVVSGSGRLVGCAATGKTDLPTLE